MMGVLAPTETFTPEERKRLAPYFTSLDAPVFALVNMPETVKGALFARYSRYPGTLRRLFLDEFAGDLEQRDRPQGDRKQNDLEQDGRDQGDRPPDAAGGQRAAQLYER